MREQVDGIKNPGEVGQGGEEKGRDDGDVVEAVGIDRIDKAAEGEEDRRQGENRQARQITMNLQVGENERDQGHRDSDGT